jgi:hypothetical protein
VRTLVAAHTVRHAAIDLWLLPVSEACFAGSWHDTQVVAHALLVVLQRPGTEQQHGIGRIICYAGCSWENSTLICFVCLNG